MNADTQQTTRAGRYVPQPNGYSAFVPAPLPPKPPIDLGNEMHAMLSRADRELGRLDGSIQTLPNPDLFVYMYIRKEAVLSSQIEGTQSSLNDLLEAEAEVLNPSRPKDVAEHVNHISAMNHGLERLDHIPISVRLIRELHEKLLAAGVRGGEQQPGQLRKKQNWIGPAGCTLTEATFVPPPPQAVPDALANLERFIHADDPMPMLIKAGLAHAQFETIHPFLDGNGRIGRLLITFLLCKHGILTKPVLYISHYFKRHRAEYYDRLQAVRDGGDWEGWLLFFLTAVAAVADEATATARRIVALRESHRFTITNTFGRTAANALKVLESLYDKPIVNVHNIEKVTRTSYAAANDLTARFVKAGILHEITGQARNRRFRYSSYIDLFTDR